MRRLIEAIPTREEWNGLNEEGKEMLLLTLKEMYVSHDLPRDDPKYHLEEMLAIMGIHHSYVFDLISEFDLAIDHNA